jgi:hypothetical protein
MKRRQFLQSSAAISAVPTLGALGATEDEPDSSIELSFGICVAEEDPRYHKNTELPDGPDCGIESGLDYTQVHRDSAERLGYLPCPLCHDGRWEQNTMYYLSGPIWTKGVHAMYEQLLDDFRTEIVAILDRYETPLIGEYLRNRCGYNMVSTFHRKKIVNEDWLEGFNRDFVEALSRLKDDGEVSLVEPVKDGHFVWDGYWAATWKEY